MDIVKIQFKPGTVVRDQETKEILKVQWFSGNFVFFMPLKDEYYDKQYYDYVGQLGKRYVKDDTYKILYGR